MKSSIKLCFFLLLAGCSKSATESKQHTVEPVSNEMTRYVGGLQADTMKAQTAVDHMNKGTAQSEQAIKEAQSQTE